VLSTTIARLKPEDFSISAAERRRTTMTLSRIEPFAKLRDVFRGGAFAEHRLHRIAGEEMDQREHEGGHSQENGNGEQQPADQETKHRSFT